MSRSTRNNAHDLHWKLDSHLKRLIEKKKSHYQQTVTRQRTTDSSFAAYRARTAHKMSHSNVLRLNRRVSRLRRASHHILTRLEKKRRETLQRLSEFIRGQTLDRYLSKDTLSRICILERTATSETESGETAPCEELLLEHPNAARCDGDAVAEAVSGHIFVTSFETVSSPDFVLHAQRNNIVAVVSLGAANFLSRKHLERLSIDPDRGYCALDVEDTADSKTLRKFTDTVFPATRRFLAHWLRCGNVLVHCRLGVSRSCAVTLDYLVNVKRQCMEESARRVAAERGCAKPRPEFLQAICSERTTNQKNK